MPGSTESAIIDAINANGPLLGKELMEKLHTGDYLAVWKACFNSGFLQISHFARYYLRYDISREEFIRLSPSILRDFLSFTILSLPHQRNAVIDRQVFLSNAHREISIKKMQIAMETFFHLDEEDRDFLAQNTCAFLAGDIAYFLAHEEPRESKSLGKIMSGSDIDIILVYRDGIDEERIKAIDEKFLKIKFLILKSSGYKEEIDFIFKPQSKMIGQFTYKDIHQKIASKILYESIYIFGSLELYMNLKKSLADVGTKKLIEDDFQTALLGRKESMKTLLETTSGKMDDSVQSLFFFSQERVEFT